ncbi:MAG: FeoB-associated Cys-rich membrane protein [Muribaculum sp.]|nr:FeoB-associated Cys-rich membrane protein [Muribaculum sp.]
MNLGTIVVLIVVCGVSAWAVRSMVRDKRSGKSLQCGMDCKNCGGHCPHNK